MSTFQKAMSVSYNQRSLRAGQFELQSEQKYEKICAAENRLFRDILKQI